MISRLNLTGNDYEIGLQLGVHFKESINKRIDKFDELLKNKDLVIKLEKIKKIIKKECPECLDEIYGRADGAKVKKSSMLLMFLPELYKKKVGCTTVACKNDKLVAFGHNEDDKGYEENDVAIVKYNYQDDWVVGYVLCDRLLGTSVGYNSKGIVHSSNYIYPDTQDETNVSRFILSKQLVRMGSIYEIENYLKNIKVSSPFSYNVFDLNTNTIVNFEIDINKTYKKVIKGKYARSNHFVLKKSKLLTASDNSKYRYVRANELMNSLDIDKISLDDLLLVLNDSTSDPIHSINIKNETIFTFGIDNINKKINMLNRFSNEKIILSYNEFIGD